jgi:hypothetical protein
MLRRSTFGLASARLGAAAAVVGRGGGVLIERCVFAGGGAGPAVDVASAALPGRPTRLPGPVPVIRYSTFLGGRGAAARRAPAPPFHAAIGCHWLPSSLRDWRSNLAVAAFYFRPE